MAPFIPRFAVFGGIGACLRYFNEPGSSLYGHIKGDEEGVSPLAKFAVEKAKCNPDLIHIRCCFSNKYLRRSTESDNYVIAAVEKPDENQSSWSCTLFKPFQVTKESQDTFSIQHVQLGYNLLLNLFKNPYHECLVASNSAPESEIPVMGQFAGDFRVINWESLVILPKYVVFKGDNGKYLHSRDDYLEFGFEMNLF